ncbi:MAG: hypothetical protein KC519_12965 [Anaerolineae bacterium]|nr:hypothetical protein [Anaerolineae bacterium]
MLARLVIELTPEESDRLLTLARRRGYDTPADYLRALIEEDATNGTDEEDPTEDLRVAWRQALHDEVLTEDEFWKAMSESE